MTPAQAALKALVAAHGPLALAVTSDLHFLAGGTREDWTPAATERFVAGVNALAPHCLTGATLALDGDIYDGWLADLYACITAHPMELAALDAVAAQAPGRVVLLVGNHDEGLRPCPLLSAFRICDELVAAGVHVEHGHRREPNPGWLRRAGMAGCRFLSWVGSRSPRVEDAMRRAYSWVEGRGRHGDADAMRAGVAAAAKAKRCQEAVCGHSHEAADDVIDGVRVLDCGTWARDGWLLRFSDGAWVRWRA